MVPAELYNKTLWEGLKGTPAPVAKTRSRESRPMRIETGDLIPGHRHWLKFAGEMDTAAHL